MSPELINAILKLGGLGVAIVVSVILLWFGFKVLLPIALAARPANGRPDSAGPLYVALQSIATLPVEIRELNATISELCRHVWTKDETNEMLRENRHDIANHLTTPVAALSAYVQEVKQDVKLLAELVERRHREDDRRRSVRRVKTRRKK